MQSDDGAFDFDLIIYGATGYTGRIVAERMIETGGSTRWAMAGRNAGKLAEIKALIGAPDEVGLIVADAHDEAALTAMAERTSVVLSTAGPFQLYGDDLVAACARTGTDYADLTGESNWIAKMLELHDATAKQTGARLLFSAGFDSIPSDLGVYFVQSEARKRFGSYAPRVRGRVRAMRSGGGSGGSMAGGPATLAAIANDPSIPALLRNPFALTPGFEGPPQPKANEIYEDRVTGSWVAPFVMAPINTKVVHRTNYLLGHPWGKDFQYDEMSMMDGPEGTPAGFNAPPFKNPGEGPSREERESGYYDMLFIAEYADGRTVRAAVKGDMDPGYGGTAKIFVEAGACLAFDAPRSKVPGGCWTAASALAEQMLVRLQEGAGVTFTVENE
ncbi:MAG: saccharopine dehydrogenase family protein [Pseudomonadota bacterium]